MIDIRPDPAHPQGGHALLVLSTDALTGDSVTVSVRDNYAGRFLGENGFQATQVAFGPYPVRREGGEAWVVVGPEIVNQIEEYTPVRLMVGEVGADVSWPDTVVPAPGAPALGGIYRAPDEVGAALTGTQGAKSAATPPPVAEEPGPAPDPAPPPEPAATAPDAAPRGEQGAGSSRLPLFLGGLALLVAAGAAAFFLLMPSDPAPDPAPVAAAPPPDAAPPPLDPCAAASLDAAFESGFADLADRLRSCTAALSADDALLYVERGADAEDPAALALFGTLYDGEVTDAPLEDAMGLTFGDAPDRAAGYYHRAVEAGSDAAQARLDAVCARLAERTDTLSRGALADHCTP